LHRFAPHQILLHYMASLYIGSLAHITTLQSISIDLSLLTHALPCHVVMHDAKLERLIVISHTH